MEISNTSVHFVHCLLRIHGLTQFFNIFFSLLLNFLSGFISVCQWPILKQHTKIVENKLCSFLWSIYMHIRWVVFNQTDLNVYKHSASLSVQVGHWFYLSSCVPHLCETFEDAEEISLRCSLRQSVHLLVVKRFCMVMSLKADTDLLVHLYLKCARKIWNTLL